MKVDGDDRGGQETCDEGDPAVGDEVTDQQIRKVSIEHDGREHLKVQNRDLTEKRKKRDRQQPIQKTDRVESQVEVEKGQR